MLIATLLLAAAPALPPVIADPRRGPSRWAFVRAGGDRSGRGQPRVPARAAAASGAPDQRWLETAVALAARAAPVVAVGSAPPPAAVRPYLDGFCSRAGAGSRGAAGPRGPPRRSCPWWSRPDDAAAAVAALAAGAAAVLVGRPDPSWEHELAGLLPEPQAARAGASELPTAMRAGDLATVVGHPGRVPGRRGDAPGRLVRRRDGRWQAARRLSRCSGAARRSSRPCRRCRGAACWWRRARRTPGARSRGSK